MVRLRRGLVVGGLAGLLAAGMAVANGLPNSSKAVSATFTATVVSQLVSSTCTGSDGSYQLTSGTYAGSSSSSEPSLNGPIVFHLRGWLNGSSHLGLIRGDWSVSGSQPSQGTLTGVNNNGTVSGWLDGQASGDARVQGTFSGSWTSSGGFGSGSIGSGSSSNLTLLTVGQCATSGQSQNNENEQGGNDNDQGNGQHNQGTEHHHHHHGEKP